MALPKILQVTPALESGGVERGTVEMANHLASIGWGSLVASAGGRMEKNLAPSVRHIKLPLDGRNLFKIITNSVRLYRLIQKESPSLVHARSRAPAWSAFFACKLAGVPFVTTFHGTYGLKGGALKKLYNSVMVRGQATIAISKFIQNHIAENYGVPAAQVPIAHRGFDATFFNPQKIKNAEVDALRKKYNIAKNTPVVLIPGRITWWKGQDLCLEALAQLKNLPWHALVVGDAGRKPHYMDALKNKIATLQLQERVTLCGNQQNMPLYYKLADIALMPSLEPEAFGRTPVEAQAMGTPVVASAHGGALETVLSGETGWLIPPHSAKALTQVLKNILKNPGQLKIVGKKAQNHVKNKFTTEKMCQAEVNVYKMLLNL